MTIYISPQKKRRLQLIWFGMRHRCNNPKASHYRYYGGKGVTVEWGSFNRFLRDMGPSYRPGLTIDRIDNEKDYEPSNCKWATRKEQNSNKRNTIRVIIEGEAMCAKEAARKLGIPYMTYKTHLKKELGI